MKIRKDALFDPKTEPETNLVFTLFKSGLLRSNDVGSKVAVIKLHVLHYDFPIKPISTGPAPEKSETLFLTPQKSKIF